LHVQYILSANRAVYENCTKYGSAGRVTAGAKTGTAYCAMTAGTGSYGHQITASCFGGVKNCKVEMTACVCTGASNSIII